jgi:dihydroorotase (multifunctional complex type)
LVIPGLVDLHVHFREPGQAYKEDFETGTKAAAAGGVTTVVDEPNNKPVISSLEALKSKQKLVKNKAHVDYILNIALFADRLDEIEKSSKSGVKIFTFFDELDNKPTGMEDGGLLLDALKRIKKCDALAFLNCRESNIVKYSIKKLQQLGKNTLEDYMNHFPSVAESVGGAKRILMTHNVGVKTHLREVSTSETIAMIRRLKPYLSKTTAEVRPDHLFLNQENTRNLGPYAQQWTPIRSLKDQKVLWDAINEGLVEIIASDHATHTREEKERGWCNIWESPPGLPAIESMLPLLLTKVNEGKLNISKLIELTSINPAKVLGIYPKKGCIKVGSDADLVILDIAQEKVILGDEFKSKSKWTPYEGWKIKGIPTTTIVNGKIVFRDGFIVSEPGNGKYLSI